MGCGIREMRNSEMAQWGQGAGAVGGWADGWVRPRLHWCQGRLWVERCLLRRAASLRQRWDAHPTATRPPLTPALHARALLPPLIPSSPPPQYPALPHTPAHSPARPHLNTVVMSTVASPRLTSSMAVRPSASGLVQISRLLPALAPSSSCVHTGRPCRPSGSWFTASTSRASRICGRADKERVTKTNESAPRRKPTQTVCMSYMCGARVCRRCWRCIMTRWGCRRSHLAHPRPARVWLSISNPSARPSAPPAAPPAWPCSWPAGRCPG